MKVCEWVSEARCKKESLFPQGYQWSNGECLYNWCFNYGLQVAQIECDDFYLNEINPGPRASEDSISFSFLIEGFDIMTYHYLLYDGLTNTHFILKVMFEFRLQQGGKRNTTGSTVPYVLRIVTNSGTLFPDNSVRGHNLKKTKMKKTNAHCGSLW